MRSNEQSNRSLVPQAKTLDVRQPMSFIRELQDRKVFRVASVYVVAMWIIIQVTSDLFPAFGIPDWAMRLVYIVAIIGFPVAVILGWAYELTPQGLKRDTGDHNEAPARRRLDLVVVTALMLLGLFLLLRPQLERLVTEGAGQGAANTQVSEQGARAQPLPTHPQSIAVLAFANMSSNPDTEYFSDGISEEVLNVLANIPGLRVASRTSAFAFKGKDAAIPDIHRALEVSFVLEGSVRRAGDQVRVTAQLIDARTDLHVWSQTYDRELLEIFAIQDEIAGAIVDKLKPVVLSARGGQAPGKGATTDDMVAYDHYLRGRSAYRPGDREALAESIEQLEEALAMDPDFARAHSALARSLAALAELDDDEALKNRALLEARTALSMDNGLREAHEVSRALTSGG